MNEGDLKKIAHFGEEYRNEFLPDLSRRDKLSSAWWEALLFFFEHAYYQGRRDTVSKEVLDACVGVLNELFPEGDKEASYDRLRFSNWRALSDRLAMVIGKGKVGKPGDIRLTVDTLKYIGTVPSKNIVAFSVHQIKNNKLHEHYTQLQHSKSRNGIRSVGPKISSFYLRDVVSLYELEKYVVPQDMVFLQPIDTWVRKVASRIGLTKQDDDDDTIRTKVVEACHSLDISPLKFNQGAWYLGYRSFEIVLRNLSVVN